MAIEIVSLRCVGAEYKCLHYYGGHLELQLPMSCGNVGSGSPELPDL